MRVDLPSKEALARLAGRWPVCEGIFAARRALARLAGRSRGVIVEHGVRLDGRTELEGRNRLLKNASVQGTRIGFGSYVGMDSVLDGARIGRFCSIGPYVRIVAGRHPTKKIVSTHPAFYSIRHQAGFGYAETQLVDEFSYADAATRTTVIIGNDVWIGHGAALVAGIRIGDGAVVGASSLVTKDVAPFTINVGVPSKIISHRFAPGEIAMLLESRWWDRPEEWLRENARNFADIAAFSAALSPRDDAR
jgi:acetyltransferase-like isoleucine patch superfamily enzyme